MSCSVSADEAVLQVQQQMHEHTGPAANLCPDPRLLVASQILQPLGGNPGRPVSAREENCILFPRGYVSKLVTGLVA